METVAALRQAATNAIWGEQKTEEPLSGAQGDTSKGEPYDAGNLDENIDNAALNTKSDTLTGGEDNYTSAPSNANVKTTVDASAIPRTGDSASKDLAEPSNSNPLDSTQASGKPQMDPTVEAKKDEAKKDDVLAAANDGPDPRPVDKAAEANDGAAGKAGEFSTGSGEGGSSSASGPLPLTGATAGPPGVPGADGVEKESHSEGTGEKYVKSTGLKADGGDFDASRAGAGREADRLLEEKGVHRDDPNHASIEDDSTVQKPHPTAAAAAAAASDNVAARRSSDESATRTGKPSLKEKIKAKLHKH